MIERVFRCLSRAWHLGLTFAALACLTVIATGDPNPVAACCNVIPTIGGDFRSTLGDVSTPLARPGQTVTIRRPAGVFGQDPAGNSISVEFTPAVGVPTMISAIPALAPAVGADCDVAECSGGLCKCISFVFPDTDAQVGGPADGQTLAGPARVTVETDGKTTAIIERLFESASSETNAMFPSFVALPPANAFDGLVGGAPQSLLAAADTAGNLFIPLDFSSLTSASPVSRPRFIEAEIPGLPALLGPACQNVPFDAFTGEGRRLPPLLRRVDPTHAVGTTDTKSSVLRVEGGASCAGIQQGQGPIVIPGVTGFADADKLADGTTIVEGDRFAVYENRECGLCDDPAQCRDLNNDGDQRDYFLYALDLRTPQATPVLIDEVDGGDFAGYPNPPVCSTNGTFPPLFLYAFDASDEVVSFLIADAGSLDIDGDGVSNELIRSGAYDLTNQQRIVEADGAVRLELGGSLLAFSQETKLPSSCHWTCDGPASLGDPCAADSDCTDGSCRGCDRLFIYDASSPSPGPTVVTDATHPEGFFVSRTFEFSIPALGSAAFDIAVANGRVAFQADERAHGEDLDGDGQVQLQALYIVDGAAPAAAMNLQRTTVGNLALGDRWLSYLTVLDTALPSARTAIGVVDAATPSDPPQLICDSGSFIPFPLAYRSLSDTIVPCGIEEAPGTPGDLNNDGDAGSTGPADPDDFVFSVYLPDAPGGPVERNLGLASFLPAGFFANVQVFGDTLVSAVDEVAQKQDMDGDGMIGEPTFGFPHDANFVLHAFHAQTGEVSNFGFPVFGGAEPFARFIDRGLSVALPTNERVFLRDIDDDGYFEDFVTDGVTGERRLDDNCPTVANPGQEDLDGDGTGDACDPCTNAAGGITIRPRVALKRINSDPTPGNDEMNIRGEFLLDAATSFAELNPITSGARVRLLIDSGDRRRRVDISLPSDAFDGTSGWKVDRSGGKFTFVDKSRPPANNGVVKVVLRDRSRRNPNQVQVQIRARNGDYQVLGGDNPIKATVIVGDGTAGECGETAFPPWACGFSRSGRSLRCRL